MLTLLSPLLIWGTLLGAIPIIIHLLNRRRFRRVEWAPMYYLRLTIQRNRRRIQFEQLLLLLLRIALIVLLFFYLARPLLNPTGLETWLGTGGRTSQVVLIDDSLSMGYNTGDRSAFVRAKEAAGGLLTSIKPQDRCTIVTTSAPSVSVVHEVEGTRRDELLAAAGSIPLSAVHAAWPAVLAGVDEVLRSCTYPTKQLTIMTDLRKAGWDRSVATWARRLQEDNVRVRIVDVGDEETANVALMALVPQDRTILSGAPSRWEAVIKNNSTRMITGAKAILRVDDKPTELKLPDLPPREAVNVPLAVQFPGSGPHEFSLQLPDDALPGDNQHWAAMPVKDSLLIRLVDGEPSAEPFGSEVDYLAAPLSIGIGAAEAWRVESVIDQDFLSPRLETPDVLVLANVASISPEEADRLNQMVTDGMGLLIFTGGKLDVALYNDMLFRQKNRLLPCALKSLTDETIHGLVVEPLHPSPLEKLLDLKASALERVPIRQFMSVEEPSEVGQVRVLARWNNPARSPAIIERAKGSGRVLLWTTTADRAGNDWPTEPSFVLAAREAVRGAARPTPMINTVNAGERMGRLVQTSHQLSNIRVSSPGGGEPEALTALPSEDPSSKEAPSFKITVPDTRRGGIYRLSWDEGAAGSQQDIFAANPDPRESELERIEAPELKSFMAPLELEIIRARNDEGNMFSSTGREIWHDLAIALLALLVLETIVATWVGRSR